MRLATLTVALMLIVTVQAGPDAGPTDMAGHDAGRSAEPGPSDAPRSADADPDDASGSADPVSPAADMPATGESPPMALQQGNGTDDNGTADDNATDGDAIEERPDEDTTLTSRTTAIGLSALALVVLVFYFVRTARK